MDAALLDHLESEHRVVEDLFAKLEKAEEAAEQRPLVEQLTAALTEHMDVEEREVYPELQKIEKPDEEMAEEAEIEHGLAREGLAKLQAMIGMPGFGAAVAMLQAGIEHHVEEEEGEAFPKLRKALGLGARSSSNGEPTKEELYEEAKKAGIEGRSQMTKDELAQAVGRD